MSLADQSFISTTPNRFFSAWSMGIGSPWGFAPQMNAPSSSSMSSFLQGESVGTLFSAVGLSSICPFGLRIGVPDGTTDEARP